MRITYLSDERYPSQETDTEQVVNTVAALARRGVTMRLCTLATNDALADHRTLAAYYQVEDWFEAKQVSVPGSLPRPIEKLSYALRAARTAVGDADVLYTRNLPIVVAGLLAGHRVAYDHFRAWPDQYPPLQPLLRAAFAHPRFLGAFFHSQFARDSFARLGLPEDRLAVVHNGWDPRRMEPRLDRVAARARIGIESAGPMIMYVGRVAPRKGLDAVLAMARLMPEAMFVIVGSEGDGPVEQKARTVPNVRVVPWQRFDATVPYLYAADVLLLPPSLGPLAQGSTVLPMKLFGYLAAGRPILAPVAPDTAELLQDGSNAILVAPNPDAAVAGLRKLLADPMARDRLALGALQTARGLTWDARAERIEGLLTQWLKGPPAASPHAHWSAVGWAAQTARWALGRGRGTGSKAGAGRTG